MEPISSPSSRFEFHHQISSLTRDALQSILLLSWYWVFSVNQNRATLEYAYWGREKLNWCVILDIKEIKGELCITFNSWTSATSFSNLSDSLRDCFSASFSSTNCSFVQIISLNNYWNMKLIYFWNVKFQFKHQHF